MKVVIVFLTLCLLQASVAQDEKSVSAQEKSNVDTASLIREIRDADPGKGKSQKKKDNKRKKGKNVNKNKKKEGRRNKKNNDRRSQKKKDSKRKKGKNVNKNKKKKGRRNKKNSDRRSQKKKDGKRKKGKNADKKKKKEGRRNKKNSDRRSQKKKDGKRKTGKQVEKGKKKQGKKNNGRKGKKAKSKTNKDKKRKSKTGKKQSNTAVIGGRNTSECTTETFATKTKKFNRVQTELRLARRVVSFYKQLTNKNNVSSSTFDESLAALNSSTSAGTSCAGGNLTEAKGVYDTLSNCSKSAAAACDPGNVTVAVNTSLAKSCDSPLETYSKAFKKCLINSTTACTCVSALAEPSDNCLNFKDMQNAVKIQKQICTKGSISNNFAACRKAQREAAKSVNNCKDCSVMTTTASSSGRRRLDFLVKQLMRNRE